MECSTLQAIGLIEIFMNIIVLSKFRGHPYRIQIGTPLQMLFLVVFALLVSAGMGAMGYWLGESAKSSEQLLSVRSELELQRQLINQTRFDAQADLDAQAARLGQIQAHTIRLNALSQRLVKIAKLDPGEFNFDAAPGVGGPDEQPATQERLDFGSEIDKVIAELEQREQQLSVLENILVSSYMKEEVFPAGRPIKRGWISSYYGTRTNPFTGKLDRKSVV